MGQSCQAGKPDLRLSTRWCAVVPAPPFFGRLAMFTSRDHSDWPEAPRKPELQVGWQRMFLSSVEEMGMVIDSVVSEVAEAGYSNKDVFGTRLALEEAICNSIKH